MSSIFGLLSGLKDVRLSSLPVALTAIAGVSLFGFLQVAHEVSEDEFAKFDASVLMLFRNPADITDPVGPPWFEEMVVEITSLGGYPVLVTLLAAVVGYLLVVRKYGPALYLALSVGSGMAISQLLKALYDRPRPDLVAHLVTTHTASFPSGHATMSTIIYLTLATLIVALVEDRRARVYVLAVAVLISVAVGLSRIYLGVHWPSDVLAGWALGAAWASLSWLALSTLRVLKWRYPT